MATEEQGNVIPLPRSGLVTNNAYQILKGLRKLGIHVKALGCNVSSAASLLGCFGAEDDDAAIAG
jgi:hypothetical protein